MGLYLGKEKISNVASAITYNADSMATEIQNHIANSDIHITADERTKWNTVTEMQNHITDNDIHITADERTKWNTAADNTEDFASTGVMNTNINMNNNSIKNLATPVENNDAANKHYVDSKALPAPSATDNGKVLSVVNGVWAAAAMSSGAYVGSYTGDGSLSKTLTFNFKPAVVMIAGAPDGPSSAIGIYGFRYLMNDRNSSTVSWTNNSFTITLNQYSSIAYNSNNVTYYYIAIPAMN